MPFSGFSASGVFNFWLVVFVGALGNLVGSLFSYWLGYLIRHNVLHWNSHRVNAEVERAQKWLDKWGDWAIFISRLLRLSALLFLFRLAFKNKISLEIFLAHFSGSFIWSAFLTYLGLMLGKIGKFCIFIFKIRLYDSRNNCCGNNLVLL